MGFLTSLSMLPENELSFNVHCQFYFNNSMLNYIKTVFHFLIFFPIKKHPSHTVLPIMALKKLEFRALDLSVFFLFS